MSFNKVCSKIAKKEGKKSQVTIGNIREVMKQFIVVVAEENIETENSESLAVIVDLIIKKIDKLRK